MILDYETLKFAWLLLIGALFIGFALTGGYDLGIAALLPFISKTESDRRVILNSIGPTWEGNQVWLITAIGAIFAAWPLMYAAIFSSFYFILFLVLFPLILRPPGFDYRTKISSLLWRNIWDFCIFISGALPIFLFGVIFGNLFIGIDFHYDSSLLPHTSGGFFSRLIPYTLFCGLISSTLLLLQGALFLQLKTVSPLSERAIIVARWTGIIFVITFLAVWAFTLFKVEGFQVVTAQNPNDALSPLVKEVVKRTGFWLHNYEKFPLGYLAPLISVSSVTLALVLSAARYPSLALMLNSTAIVSVIVTAGFTLFPFILTSTSVPGHSLTIWDATSSYLTLAWMFGVTLILLPIVLGYTIWVFRVMRGKVIDNPALNKKQIY